MGCRPSRPCLCALLPSRAGDSPTAAHWYVAILAKTLRGGPEQPKPSVLPLLLSQSQTSTWYPGAAQPTGIGGLALTSPRCTHSSSIAWLRHPFMPELLSKLCPLLTAHCPYAEPLAVPFLEYAAQSAITESCLRMLFPPLAEKPIPNSFLYPSLCPARGSQS